MRIGCYMSPEITKSYQDFVRVWREVCDRLQEIINEFVDSVVNIVENLKDINLASGNGMSPKKYGLSLMKKESNTKSHNTYRYLRTAPRNLPYQRRSY